MPDNVRVSLPPETVRAARRVRIAELREDSRIQDLIAQARARVDRDGKDQENAFMPAPEFSFGTANMFFSHAEGHVDNPENAGVVR